MTTTTIFNNNKYATIARSFDGIINVVWGYLEFRNFPPCCFVIMSNRHHFIGYKKWEAI